MNKHIGSRLDDLLAEDGSLVEVEQEVEVRIRFLAFIANILGVQFKIGGLPMGASYERSMWMQPLRDAGSGL